VRTRIGFLDVTAGRIRIGTVGGARAHREDPDASASGLAGHEETRLKERPTVPECPANRAIGVFRSGRRRLAEAVVVGVCGKTAFFSGEPREFAFGRPHASGLQ